MILSWGATSKFVESNKHTHTHTHTHNVFARNLSNAFMQSDCIKK